MARPGQETVPSAAGDRGMCKQLGIDPSDL